MVNVSRVKGCGALWPSQKTNIYHRKTTLPFGPETIDPNFSYITVSLLCHFSYITVSVGSEINCFRDDQGFLPRFINYFLNRILAQNLNLILLKSVLQTPTKGVNLGHFQHFLSKNLNLILSKSFFRPKNVEIELNGIHPLKAFLDPKQSFFIHFGPFLA